MRFLFAALLSAHILSAGAVSAADSLVAYWALDDSAGTALDNSTYGNDGVLQGGAAWEPGIAGNALRCSGTGDYVDCGTDASFDFTKAFTLSAWFKTSMEASAGLICKSANNGNNCSYRLHKTEGNDVVQFSVSADGSPWAAYIYSTTVVKDGEWHHAVGVYDGTAGRMELYLDGVKEGAIVGAVPESLYQNDLNVEVGRTNEYYCMDGLIDEVKMFNVALDEAEITGLYREFSHPDAVYWSFDEGSGSVAGSADDADYPFEIFNASWNSEGVSGSCLEFNYQNGYGDYAEVRDTSFAACEERFSFSMWVYPYTSPSGTQKEHILEKCYRNDNDTRGYQVSLLYGQFHFSTSQPDGQWENGGAMAFGPTINAGQWYHLAFTWDKDVDGGALYGYVDGVRYHIYTKTTTQYVQNLPLLIGRYVEKPEQSDYCFNGRLDEIRYYGRALDSTEVTALYDELNDVETPLFLTLDSISGSDGIIDISATLTGPDASEGYSVNSLLYRFTDSSEWLPVDTADLTGNEAQQPGDVSFGWNPDGAFAGHATESAYVSFRMGTDGGTGAWDTAHSLPAPRYELSADFIDSKLYVAGGSSNNYSGKPDLFIYDAVSGEWSTGASIPVGTMNMAHGVIDGQLYLAGGASGSTQLDGVYRYTPRTDTWDTLAPMPEACAHAAYGVINGKLYVAGGSPSGYIHSDRLYVYDPATDTWAACATMPEGRRCAAAVVIDGELYIMGGNNGASNSNYLSSVIIYNPGTDVWRTAPNLPKPLLCHDAVYYNGTVYLLGGYAPSNDVWQDSVMVYEPLQGTWSAGPCMTEARIYAAATAYDGRLYAVGGRFDGVYSSTLETLAVNGGNTNYVTGGPIAVNDINMAPVITSDPVIDAVAGLPWVYYVTASDQDSNDLVFAVESAPAGMTVDSDAGILQWVPEDTDTGTVTVTVSVSDGHGGSDSQTFDLTVHAAADSSESDITGPGHCFCGGTGARLTVVSMGGSGKIKVIVHADSFPPYLPESGKPVKRTYKIEADSTLTGLQVALTLAYLQEEFNASGINNEKSLYAARYHNGKWEQMPSTVDTLANTVTCNTDGFSIWAIGGDGGPLPVSLSSLTAQTGDEGVILRWTTESETGNLGWNVQRRTAAAPGFDQVNGPLIPGAGTTVEPQTYSYIDAVHAGGAYLYRLEQIDINGTKSYSDEVDVSVVTLGIDGPQLITGSPVRYGIRFRNPKAGNVTVRLYSSDGTVRSIPADGYFDRGEHMVPLPATAEAGIYLVRIDTAAGSTTAKLVITR